MSDGVKIDPRTLPIPLSISPEAQATLKRLVRDDGVPFNAVHSMPAPDDHDGWRRLQVAVAQNDAAAQQGLAASLRAHIETINVGDAVIHVATAADAEGAEFAYIDLHGGALVFGGG